MKGIRFRVFYDNKLIPCEVTMDDYVHIFDENDNKFFIVGCVGSRKSLLKNINVMQYTGLNDKNNKPIYEGDVVKMELYNKIIKGAVVFHKGSFVIETTDDFYFLTSPESLEIVGNIYNYKEEKN